MSWGIGISTVTPQQDLRGKNKYREVEMDEPKKSDEGTSDSDLAREAGRESIGTSTTEEGGGGMFPTDNEDVTLGWGY